MAYGKILIGVLLAAASVPASAAVQVHGSSDARLCFEAAESASIPTSEQVRRCDEALRVESLSSYDTIATHVNRGILYMRRGAIDAAIADFDTAIELDPSQPEAYLNKGAALVRREQPDQAVGLFTVALERNTSRPEVAHYGRAVANEALGNVRAAYNDYRRANELAPRWREPRLDLARFRVSN